jgi:hypothetical protein
MGWLPLYIAASTHREEEQILSDYRAQDPEGRYEYKMLYGRWGAFRDPNRLHRVLAEEAWAQWSLVEQLDHERLVLRRPRTARRRDRRGGSEVAPHRRFVGQRRGPLLAVLVTVATVVGIPLTLLSPVYGVAMVMAVTAVAVMVAVRG